MFRCGEDGENSSCCISEEVNTNTMNTALQKHYEKHLIETQPVDYRKSLEKRWDDLQSTLLYEMYFYRNVNGEDDKHFQKLRKTIEKVLGEKIKKTRGSLNILHYKNNFYVGATNEEDRIKRETLFARIKNNETEREKWEKIFSSKFFSLFPDADCKKVKQYLSPIVSVGLGVRHFAMIDQWDSPLHFNIPYTQLLLRKMKNMVLNGMGSAKNDFDYNLEKGIWTEQQYLKNFSRKLEQLELLMETDVKPNTIHINDLLSQLPEIEKDIEDEVARKTKSQRKQVKLGISFDLDISMCVDLECIDEKDMKEKIVERLKEGLENISISIPSNMDYGDDFFAILDVDVEKSFDYRLLETTASTSTDTYEDLVKKDNPYAFTGKW